MSPTRQILVSSCAILLVQTAIAQDTFTWTGAGANGNWSTALNWTGGVPNGNDLLNFGGTVNLSTTNDLTAYNGHRIIFQTGAGAFTLSGNALTLFDFGPAAPKIENLSTVTQTLNFDVALDGSAAAGGTAEINPVNGDLILNGAVNLADAGNTHLLIYGNNGKTVTFNNAISGANPITVKQNSTVVLNGLNTFTGLTTLEAGRVQLGSGSGLGDTVAGTIVASGATLDLNGQAVGTEAITISGTGAGNAGALINESAFGASLDGILTLGADSTIGGAGDIALNGAIAGNQNLTKRGAGVLSLRAQSPNWNGNVIVNEGILRFDRGLANSTEFNNILGAASNALFVNGTTLNFAYNTGASVDRTLTGRVINVGSAGATIDVQGSYSNFSEGIYTQIRFSGAGQSTILRGSGTLTKNGGGRIQLQNASPEFSGAVVLNDGTFETLGTALGDSSSTNTITINGGNLAMTGDFTQPLVTLNGGALSTTGASRSLTSAVNVAADSHVFLNNFWTDAAAGWTITMNGIVSGSGRLTVGVNRPGYDANNGALILRNTGNTYSGTLVAEKGVGITNESATGSGKTIGTAAVVLQGGKLNVRDNGAGSNGVLNYGNNVTVEDIFGNGDLAGVATIDVNRSSGVNVGNTIQLGTLTMGAQTLNVVSGNGYGVRFAGLTTLTSNATFNISSGSLTLGGGLSAAGQTITKDGIGTLRLLGATNYGGYVLNAGTIEVPTEPTGTGRTIALPVGTGFGAGYVATQANLIDRITLDSAGVVALGVSSTFNPNFTGFTGGLRLGGTANAVLTGTITPADATVRLGGGGGNLTLASTNAIMGAVNLDVNTNGTAPGTVILAGANNFSGTVAIGGGMTLRIASAASLGSNTGPISLDNGVLELGAAGNFSALTTRVFNLGTGGGGLDTGGNNFDLQTALTGTGTFIKAGAGTLTLPAANSTFTGKTTINGGAIAISADTQLGAVPGTTTVDQLKFDGGALIATADVTIPVARGITLNSGGGTIDTGTNTVTVNSVMAGTGGLIKGGTGTLVLAADNNYTGPTSINQGVLQVSVNVQSDVTVNSGATLLTTGGNSIQDGQTVTVNSGGIYDIRASDTIGRLVGGGTVTRGVTGTSTLNLNSGTAATFDGVIENGVGTLALTKSGANTVTLTGTNTHTGATIIGQGQIRVEGATARLSGGGIVSIGDNNGNDESLVIGSNTDVVNTTLDHLADTTQLEFRGTVPVTINGPTAASTAFTETMGQIDFREGAGMLTLSPSTGGQLQLNASSLIRENNNAIGVIRGTNLGGTGANSSRLLLDTLPALVGSGGSGSLASIIPFILAGTNTVDAPSTFVRYDAVNGITPLAAADYATSIAGSAGRNVSTTGEAVAASTSVNALRVTGGTVTIAAGEKLSVDSGAILFTSTGVLNGPGTIEFGGRQAIITASGDTAGITATIGANLRGAGGIAIGDAGNVTHTIVLSGDNSITGLVVINNGILRAGSAGALNQQFLTDLVLRAGNSTIAGATASAFQLGGNNIAVVMSGGDRLQGSTRVQNASADPATFTIVTTATSDGNDGVIENGAGGGALSFVKLGSPQLTLEQNNTYTGSTLAGGGILRLRGGAGALSGTSDITIRTGTLTVRNEGSGNVNANRLPDAAPIAMEGGAFIFEHTADSTQSYSENAGPLRLVSGGNSVSASQAATGRTSLVVFDSLERLNRGTVVNFGGTGLGTSVNRNRINFDVTAPTLDDGIIGGWAFLGGDFASYQLDIDAATTGNQGSIVPATYDANVTNASQAAWTSSSNIRPTENVTLTANRTVNAVNLGDAIDANLGGFTLVSDSGGFLTSGASAKTISNGTLTAGTPGNELFFRTEGATQVATVSATIANNTGGAVDLVKTGAGKLVLSASANTYSGRTVILEGAVSITDDAQLGPVPGAATAGKIVLDGGTLEINGAVSLNANRGISVGVDDGVVSVRSGGLLTYEGSLRSDGPGSLTISGERVASGSSATVASSFVSLATPLNLTGGLLFNTAGTLSLSGTANRIGGTFQVGANQADATASYNNPGGTLTIGNDIANLASLNIGFRSIDSGATNTLTRGTLDLTGSENLNVTVNNVFLGVITGVGGSGGAEGHLVVGKNSSIKALSQVLLSNSTGSGNDTPLPSDITFGAGTNSVVTPLFTVGGQKGDGAISITPGGTLNLTGFGANSTDLFIARNNLGGTGTISLGTANLDGGTFIADLDEFVVAHKSGTGGTLTGGANGQFTSGATANDVSANSIKVAERLGDATGNVSGMLNWGGGRLTSNGDLGIGLANGTGSGGTVSGTFNLYAGDVSIAGDVQLAQRASAGSASGTLAIYGGTMTVGGDLTTSNAIESLATVIVDGGTLDLTGGNLNAHILSIGSGGLRNIKEIYTGDGTTVGTLSKFSPGTLTVGGVNAYTGATSVDAGALLLSGSLSGTSAVNVAGGAKFGGTGVVNPAATVTVAAGGTLAPGLTTGTLATGSVVFQGGKLEIDLGTGGAFDQLAVTGSVSLNAPVELTMTIAGLYSAGTQFMILQNDGGEAISFGNGARLVYGGLTLNENDLFVVSDASKSQGFRISYIGGTGNDIVLTAVPEPGAAAILLGAATVLGGMRRLRRRK